MKIKGRWTYLYRAVNSNGKTVDFLLRTKRDAVAAKVITRRALEGQRRLPRAITLDGYQALHRVSSSCSLHICTSARQADQAAIVELAK